MAKYEVTFNCNHTATVELYGPTEMRRKRIQRMEAQPCYACQRKKQIEAIGKWEEEMDLPDLIGSPKQIAWARRLRYSVLSQAEENFNLPQYEKILDVFSSQVSVRFWIDNEEQLNHCCWEDIKDLIDSIEDEPLKEEARQSAIIRTKNITHDGYVELSTSGKQVRIIYAKRSDDLIKLVKQFGFRWDSKNKVWYREVFPFSSIADQIAEIGNILLHAGFSCCILDDDAREKSITGEYKAIGKRLLLSEDGKDFSFQLLDYEERDEFIRKLYKIGGRCNCGKIIVGGTMYRAVGDFAKKYGFKVSSGAKRLIESQIQREIKVSVGDHLEPEKIEQIGQKIKSNEPLADLLDDD